MLQLQVTDSGLRAQISALLAFVANPLPMYRAIGAAIRPVIDARFDSRTDPNGRVWEPWAESTRGEREKERNDPHRDSRFIGTMMQHYGEMRRGLQDIADSTGVEVGFDAEYARFHEQVDTSKKEVGKMPRRGLLFKSKAGDSLSDSDNAVVLAAAMNALRQQLV